MVKKSGAIELSNVTKLYGSVVGAQDLTLSVERGTIFGFLGPNGAGKTTTISMLVDLLRPTSGSISILGHDSVKESVAVRQKIGFLSGDMALDNSLTGWQQIEYFGNLRGGYEKTYVKELASRLDCKLDRRFKNLSRGNRQKVGLITALMHKPELLILDEPTSGLDPLIQAEFNKIIKEQKKRGATAFISSHVLSEVQEVCDHIAFIRSGKLIDSQPINKIIARNVKTVSVNSHSKTLLPNLRQLAGVKNLRQINSHARFDYQGDINQLLKTLTGQKLTDVEIRHPELEDIFMKYYEQKDA